MDHVLLKKPILLTLTTITILTTTACGKNHADTTTASETTEVREIREETQEDAPADTYKEEENSETAPAAETAPSTETTPATETAAALEMKSKFGENCIGDQTFEIELSEYEGKVFFVPFMPSGEWDDFQIQIIQNGNVLDTLESYVPDKLRFQSFTSLDAVSFFDINYDGETDIVLIETYGDTSFAVVYCGEVYTDENDVYFHLDDTLSDNLSENLQTLSIPEIRNFLSGGKKNGEFTSYQEAYTAAARFCSLKSDNEYTYDLIYVDEDDIPELSAGIHGYFVDLYTYQNGTLYLPMNRWPYGAGGNSGYEYAPRQNSIRNFDQDFAGLIMNTTYMKINEEHAIETVASIKTYNFDDANGNGQPDEEEMDSVGNYGASYLDGEEISDETWDSYEKGEYSYIPGEMSFDELMAALQER